MRKSVGFVLFAVLPAMTFASSTVTPTPGKYVLRNKNNTDIATLPSPNNRFDNEQLCYDAAKKLPAGDYKCDMSIGVKVVSTCTDEPKPVLAQEQRVLHSTLKKGSDTEYEFSEVDYIKNPKGDAAYPACWILGDVPAKFASENEPELPNVMEPFPVTQAYIDEWMSEKACLERHAKKITYDNPTGCPDPISYWLPGYKPTAAQIIK